jgi:hypothetical protein
MLTKQCIQNLLLSKFFFFFFSIFHFSYFFIFSDLGSYQQPSREALSTLQDVTVAGVGKKIRFFFCFYVVIKYLARTMCDVIKSLSKEDLSSPSILHKKYRHVSITHNFDPSELFGSKRG